MRTKFRAISLRYFEGKKNTPSGVFTNKEWAYIKPLVHDTYSIAQTFEAGCLAVARKDFVTSKRISTDLMKTYRSIRYGYTRMTLGYRYYAFIVRFARDNAMKLRSLSKRAYLTDRTMSGRAFPDPWGRGVEGLIET